MNIERDGHVHSPYCPHGSNDSFEKYITEAITKGIKEITFTEHLMFPKEIVGEEFYKTCAPDEKALECYFKEIDDIKVNYKDKIKVNTGLEVDYIEGYEEELRESLNKYGRRLDDGILSVHFLKVEDKFYAVDGLESFEDLLKSVGTLSKVYDLYFDTLIKAIKSDLGEFKPRRIGHPTLVRIFNKKYPYN
ncbi:MAG: histidinol-phosphatase HisJ, partial [Clostridium sp.]